MPLFKVTHRSFQTDTIVYTSDVFEGEDEHAALNSYNELAKTRTEYPYMWTEEDINSVEPLKINGTE